MYVTCINRMGKNDFYISSVRGEKKFNKKIDSRFCRATWVNDDPAL